ncbi:MAG: hypothetical protein JKX73_04600 [Flavobacteriales bacterium]|nr:hypothetical protein [Flavobacteriales bacterium]
MGFDRTEESREVDCATLWKLNSEIVLIRFNDGCHLDGSDAKTVGDAAIELFEGGKFLAIIDARNMGGTVGKEASNYFAQNEKLAAHRLAQAIVVNTLAMKLIAQFYIKVNKPRREAKIFNELDKALAWLETKKYLLG